MDGDDARWRPPLVLFIPIVLCAGLIFFVDVFQPQSLKIPMEIAPAPAARHTGYSEEMLLKGFLIKTEGCRIPDMNAFDPSVAEFIYDEPPIVCNNNTPPLVESDSTSLHLIRASLPRYGVGDVGTLKCCYSAFRRSAPKPKEPDNKGAFGKECVQFNGTARVRDEFVRVVCTNDGAEIYKDFFAFVPVKNGSRGAAEAERRHGLNVLVMGLDAVSRLNLHRQMPKTVRALRDLSAIEFFGYNKVGDNTFPNLIPVLTGLSEEELARECWPSPRARFDDCPFVWKNFSERGFATAFGEDSAWMGIFNYMKRGFVRQPTDYFWGPFNYVSEAEIGNEHRLNAYQCVGARTVYSTLLRYVDRFVRTMRADRRRPYFGFFWGVSLTHDYLNMPKLGDDDYARFLDGLRADGLLDETVLIFMSDHGIRWGSIRSTYQGRMEERLPFLFVALPERYRSAHGRAYANARKNSRRLTTPFDLHETLKDLLDADGPPTAPGDEGDRRNARGRSLFRLVPGNRTCEEAGIAPHWCTCQQSTDVDRNDSVVKEVARFAIRHINGKLDGYAECTGLSLSRVLNARLHSSTEHVLVGKNVARDYTVVFQTTPGDGIFEATVRRRMGNNSTSLAVTGTISRINLYGKQSLCITDFHLKLYCYCRR